MKMKNGLMVLAIVGAFGIGSVHAEETVAEKAGEVAQDAGKNVKKGYRAAKDKACEMVNGKMECAGQKVKHGAQNAADEVSDKANDIKKKVN